LTFYNYWERILKGWCMVARISEDTLWAAYWATDCSETARNALIELYFQDVRAIAMKLVRKIGTAVEADELVAAGVFELVDAMTRFDSTRGLKFMTFASLRIRGAMQDSLRQLDIVPRLARSRQKQCAAMRDLAERQYRCRPTDHEVAALAGKQEEDLVGLAGDSAIQCTMSIDQSRFETDLGRARHLADTIADKREQPAVTRERQREILRMVTKGMNQNERLIIVLYYYEAQTMKDIGRTLGLSESRVSQMHSAVIVRLKERLKDCQAEFVV
jgi:RNA polymerase sigma factor for flagellar operon FliA